MVYENAGVTWIQLIPTFPFGFPTRTIGVPHNEISILVIMTLCSSPRLCNSQPDLTHRTWRCFMKTGIAPWTGSFSEGISIFQKVQFQVWKFLQEETIIHLTSLKIEFPLVLCQPNPFGFSGAIHDENRSTLGQLKTKLMQAW